MSEDALKRALLASLGPRPSPAQRRRLADELRALADEQERLAEAAEREQRRPGEKRVGTRKPAAGPGRAPGDCIQIVRREAPDRHLPKLEIYVGRKLYYALGSPERLDVRQRGTQLFLVAAAGTAGYAVHVGRGMPRITAGGARELLEGMDGHYRAEVRDGRIEIGKAIDAT